MLDIGKISLSKRRALPMKKLLACFLVVCVCLGITRYYDLNICGASTDSIAYETSYSKVKTLQDINGKVYAQSIVGITNTGTCSIDLGVNRYDLEDVNGELISSENSINSYPNIIEPGETGYYYDILHVKNLQIPQELNIVLNHEWTNDDRTVHTAIKETKEKRRNFNIVKIKHYVSENDKSIDLKCTVSTIYEREIHTPFVTAIFFDENENPITIMRSHSCYYDNHDLCKLKPYPNKDKQVEMEYMLKIDMLPDRATMVPNDVIIDANTEYIIYAY